MGERLGPAGLEELHDSRQTLRDVRAGDTAGVERPHGQLRAGLTDGLRGNNAHRVARLTHLARGKVAAVAARAHAHGAAALER